MVMTKQKRSVIFLVVLLSTIVSSFLSTALNTALPQIMADYRLSATTGQWVTSIYSLIMGIAVLATAYLVKRIPTKRLFLLALLLFSAGLLLDGLPLPFPTFMLGRVLQAVSNGVLMALTQVIILTIFPVEQRGTYMGIYGLAVGVAPILAPTLAGIIIDATGWRIIFYSTLALMLVLLAVSAFVFEDVLQNEKLRFDAASMALCSLGYIGILLALGNISAYGFVSLNVLLPLGLGLVGSIAFIARQLRSEKPFLEVRVFKVKQYRIAVISSMLLYLAMMAATILVPIYLQTIRGYSATISGLVMIPGSAAMAILSPMIGKLYDKFGIKKLFIIGAALQVISYLGMTFLGDAIPLWYITVMQTVRNIAIGFLMMPLATWGMAAVGQDKTSDGTSLLTSLRTVAGAIGTAVFVGLMTAVGRSATDTIGMNVTFMVLAALGAVQLLIAVFAVHDQLKERIQ